ncbi:UDP-N-acetylmuramoyl-tripeptide--D-alanyl-D-alanine ligase [Thermotomaculum hydrothermale]|uniref:UDP-N-acetylmuramoyl-tripeptide--D-alanyl-D-alanine ligase n=1 Tax=Thermotomaculum hydrothermale TaxID=981385 RepID=A0A7R6PUA6_9BACT|nr:UDP-N-acetylmuramoyl-tripeptide--D-alanyl-D-alanine ligase [Thermotomaculum hydrothermale]BBB32802.1 UDP-N-acetylmuramoyl-tripeptide--D-alanyl-D-alanine ligase [Thermotomaculum hydrothermale]
MKVSEFAKLIGKEAYNFKEREIKGFSIDTRTIKEGEMFIAIKTDRDDGHRFIEDAKRKGACSYLLSYKRRSIDLDAFENLFFVGDTVQTIQKAAKNLVSKKVSDSVAITGSAGKTTTKELTYHIFKSYFKTRSTLGNFNNTLGLPLSILNTVDEKIDYFIAELGMSYKGEIKRLIDILNPNIRVWLNVYPAHIGNFGSIEEVRDAKAEILLNQDPDTVIVYNYDDILVKSKVDRAIGVKYSFGKADGADLKIKKCETGLNSSILVLEFEGKDIVLKSSLVGDFNCYNIAASVLTALLANVSIEKIKESVESFVPLENRGRFVIKDRILLYNDCYNSNPEALKRIISHFSSVEHKGRKVAIIGDMLELGGFSEEMHREIGKLLNKSDFDLIITWGKDARFINSEVEGKAKFHFEKNINVAEEINNIVKEGDLIIVKASRGMKGEVIIDEIIKKWGEK